MPFRRFFAVCLPLLLVSACAAPRFDSNELMLVAQIKQNVMIGEKTCDSDPYTAVSTYGSKIIDNAQLYGIYAEHLPGNQNSKLMADILSKMTKEMDDRRDIYSNVSKGYCKMKFSNIADAADRIMVALSKKGIGK